MLFPLNFKERIQLNDRIVFKRIAPSQLRDCCQVATGASGLNLPSVLISNFAAVKRNQPTNSTSRTNNREKRQQRIPLRRGFRRMSSPEFSSSFFLFCGVKRKNKKNPQKRQLRRPHLATSRGLHFSLFP
jgi:hypothetical protein